jgi:hypothetical protein
MRVRLPTLAFGFMAILVVAACVGQTGVADPTQQLSAGQTPEAGSSDPAAPGTTPALTPGLSTPGMASPGASPSLGATTHPQATVAPTLDWAEVGYAIGVRDPVALGGNARVELDAPVGPTCTLSAKYPNGKSAAVGSPSHPKSGAWVWSWTVPTTAGLGKATISFGCTYGGLTKPGSDSFQLVAALPTPTPKPTPTPTWSISGSVTTPVSAKNGMLTFTGHVNGTPPPGIAPIDLSCRFYVTYSGFDQLIASEGSVQTRDFTLAGPIGYPTAATYHWHVTCAATLNAGTRQAAGTFVAQ